jgi:hypothetical protein
MRPFADAIISASWQGRLVRSLSPDISIQRSVWLSILAASGKAEFKIERNWFVANHEPMIERVRLNEDGTLTANYYDRYGNYRKDFTLPYHINTLLEEMSKMRMRLLMTPPEIVEFNNACIYWLRHRPAKYANLIPGFTYTGAHRP